MEYNVLYGKQVTTDCTHDRRSERTGTM